MKYYSFVKGNFAGIDNELISATGYTGSGGIEIYFENKNDNANLIWDKIFEAGKSYELKPAGLAARDTLRLEMGYCLYGNDIDDTTSPLEAGLGWIVKSNKDFIAKPILEKQKNEGIKQKLSGLEMVEKGIPRNGYQIQNKEGEIIGRVTSGTQSPTLQKPIAMGYVSKDYAKINTEVFIKIRDKLLLAKVVKMPFE
jgi:aminomethyltransferase